MVHTGTEANCNICQTRDCHKFLGTKVSCRNYLPPEPFSSSILEHLLMRSETDRKAVYALFHRMELRLETTHEKPFFNVVQA